MIKIFRKVIAAVVICSPFIVNAEMQMVDDDMLSDVSGQEGVDIKLVNIRVNADVDGYTTDGFSQKYVTRNVDGTDKAVLGVAETSLAFEMEGAISIDVDGKGVKVGAPDKVSLVGDGLRMQNIYVNSTGSLADGGVLLDEIQMTGTFNTTGNMWISSQ